MEFVKEIEYIDVLDENVNKTSFHSKKIKQ